MNYSLEAWINPRHLSDGVIDEARNQIINDPGHTLWLDDFLLPPRVTLLQQMFERDGAFRLTRCIIDYDHPDKLRFVDSDEFATTPREKQFEYETSLVGPAAGREQGLGYQEHLEFIQFCRQPSFAKFLCRMTGVDPVGIESFQVRSMEENHFVARHTDNGRKRRLCMVLYLSREWRHEDSGQFRQFLPDGSERTLDPRPNRVVLFHVSAESWHEVIPLVAGAHPRWSYTVWMGG